MAFTHGMNVEDVRQQADLTSQESNATTESRGDANDTIHNLVADSWWGPDADMYLDAWMGEVDPLYSQLAEMLQQLGIDTQAQAQQQEDASAS
ncbi:hypothetical protein GCM10011490_13130 [Pseudoclavibacter endophyticus]|uniref:WXG100 family type VII secretion target n=1 Tax=Pseudoclavibacter endophyticus TaxID=1778590 RepID=A0A6H9WNJ7_9MICO|nr:hypothetical protein [Pseudoclavibacter endophyticus]KAB1649281.1 hypothetical protein F8O04_03130 [Pseudoclavibacter endophyticus]GGA63881.1 hypothetical protein GCM10011490_13130 [Pseudoclavibacter endophyticus]